MLSGLGQEKVVFGGTKRGLSPRKRPTPSSLPESISKLPAVFNTASNNIINIILQGNSSLNPRLNVGSYAPVHQPPGALLNHIQTALLKPLDLPKTFRNLNSD